MKKFLCAFLSLCMVFLLSSCADSGNETPDTTAETSFSEAAQSQTLAQDESEEAIKTESGYAAALLPENFPDLSSFNVISTSTCKADDEYLYEGEFTRIKLTATTTQLSLLSGTLMANGWFGTAVLYNKEDFGPTVMYDLPEGFWQNGEYLALIAKYSADVTPYETNYLLYIDVIKAGFGLPDEITEFFPDINGAHIGAGTVSIYDINGKPRDFSSNINRHYWRWDFLQGTAFCSVTGVMFDEYLQALKDSGFTVNTAESSDNYGPMTMVAADKKIGSKTYTVSLIYYRYSYNLNASFTNNAEFFTQ